VAIRGFTLWIPFAGAVVGTLGYVLDVAWMFWLGAAIAAFNELMNVWSGAYLLPYAALVTVTAGVLFLSPWTIGVGVGLIAAAAVDVFRLTHASPPDHPQAP